MDFKRVSPAAIVLAAALVAMFAGLTLAYGLKKGAMELAGSAQSVRDRLRLGRIAQIGIALAALACVYLLINRGPAAGGVTQTQIVQPSLWAALAVLILLLSRLGEYRLSFSRALLPLALLAGAFHVSLLISGGVLVGFGHSPYSHTLQGIITNLSFVFSSLVALELTRAYLLSALGRQRPILMLAVTALLFTFVTVSLAKITTLDSGAKATTFLGETGLPLLAQNLLASYLALLGGPLPAIAYRAMLEAYEWFSPVLPNLGWVGRAFLGTIAPAIGFLAVRTVCQEAEAAESRERAQPGRARPVAWVVLSIIGVGIVWFSVGLFSAFPVVTSGNSMDPTLRHGDLVVLHTVSADSVEAGDIIRFWSEEEGWTLHRVIAVEGTDRDRVFTTKGDNNSLPDPPVLAQDVEGKVLFYIPKVGYLGLGVKELIVRASGLLK